VRKPDTPDARRGALPPR